MKDNLKKEHSFKEGYLRGRKRLILFKKKKAEDLNESLKLTQIKQEQMKSYNILGKNQDDSMSSIKKIANKDIKKKAKDDQIK